MLIQDIIIYLDKDDKNKDTDHDDKTEPIKPNKLVFDNHNL